jgi:hypothetical protein
MAWVYDTIAGIGYVDAIIDLIIGIVIFIIFIIIGLVLLFKRKIWYGVGCIVIAFIVLLLALIWYYFVSSSKEFAAAAGVVTIANVAIGGYTKRRKNTQKS